MIVEEKAARIIKRPQVRFVRQHEFHRPDDVRGDPEQRFALGERLGDEPEFEVLQVAKPAVDQLVEAEEVAEARSFCRPAALSGPVRRHRARTRAVDAAANDQEIVLPGVHAGVDSMSTW